MFPLFSMFYGLITCSNTSIVKVESKLVEIYINYGNWAKNTINSTTKYTSGYIKEYTEEYNIGSGNENLKSKT